jgi:NADH-quinone oxidoreductase subunit M
MILAAETAELGFPLLSTMVVLPALGALLVALVPSRRGDMARMIGFGVAVAVGMLTVSLLIQFDAAEGGFQFVSRHEWIAEFGISWHLGVDGISLFLVVLAGLLFPIAILGVDPHHDRKAYTAWMLLLEAGTIGAFLALDLFLFFVFFEIVLVPMYFLIGRWGYENRVYASYKFFIYTMAGSALMLVGILTLAFLSAGDGPLTFDLVEIAENGDLATNTARWLFLAFALAFAVKVPLFPFHTWLPDAHTQAPTGGSVILAGVMLKLGTYGFMRFGLFLFPEATTYFGPVMVTLGVIGIVYGAVVAAMQADLKRLVAYSSIAHLGFIVLGTFALTTQSMQGGVIQMVNHGITTGALFLLVGMIYERRHTREIARLKGLQKSAPVLAGVFTVVMFASVGLPGLNGFPGEFLVLIGSFLTYRWWAVVAATGVILAALYLLWAYQRSFHGEPDEDNVGIADMNWREGLVMAPLLALIVFLGVYPKPMLERVEPAVDRLIAHIEERTDYVQPGVAREGVPAVAEVGAGGHDGNDDGGGH